MLLILDHWLWIFGCWRLLLYRTSYLCFTCTFFLFGHVHGWTLCIHWMYCSYNSFCWMHWNVNFVKMASLLGSIFIDCWLIIVDCLIFSTWDFCFYCCLFNPQLELWAFYMTVWHETVSNTVFIRLSIEPMQWKQAQKAVFAWLGTICKERLVFFCTILYKLCCILVEMLWSRELFRLALCGPMESQ